jgi:putative tryptophan/tyrosine transport system substrate-binding protein
MKRREFLKVIVGSAAAWPLVARAQPGVVPRLGVMRYGSLGDAQVDALQKALREMGYEAGRNIAIDFRHADERTERLPVLAAELVALNPDAILAFSGEVAVAVRDATKKIPIIFSISSDPVQSNLVASLPRPGGNATGVTFLQDELAAKRLQLFKEAAPKISRVAFLYNPDHRDNERREAERAAAIIGVELALFEARTSDDIRNACAAAKAAGVDSLYVVSSGMMVANIATIVSFATDNSLPLVGGWGAWTEAGAFLSYGPNVGDMVRRSYGYVDRILKGASPATLPVEQPTKFELHVNLKAAKTLDLTVSEAFLLRADSVIE